jgi:hypothetical protein
MTKPLLYLNPAVPREMWELFLEIFPDVPRASPEQIEAVVGTFLDGGPPLANYDAALLDERGELTLYGGFTNFEERSDLQ